MLYALLIHAYLLGSLPFSLWLVRARLGVDLRTQGSGNAGATNAGRLLGIRGYWLVLALDLGKGAAAVALPLLLGFGETVLVLCAALAVVGHVWPLFARFRGGKGASTALGAALLLTPQIAGWTLLALLVTRALCWLLARRVPAWYWTLAASVCYALLALWMELGGARLAYALLLPPVLAATHHQNWRGAFAARRTSGKDKHS